jgi:hypothetical protein
MALGDRLAGVLLYHVHPGEALSLDQLRARDNVTTALGARLGQPEVFVVSVDATSPYGATVVRSISPGNKASVGASLQVCGTTVHTIDQVLVPAETLAGVPNPGPIPAAPAPAAAAATQSLDLPPGPLDGGVAAAVGPLAGCAVTLMHGGAPALRATTDAAGRFSFPGVPACAVANATLLLPAGLDQLATCVDAATGMPPMFSLSAVLSSLLGGGAGGNASLVPSGGTREAPLNLSPLTNLLSSLLGAEGGGSSGVLGVFGDFVSGLVGGDPGALAAATSNAQALISGVVGGSALAQLVPGAGVDRAVAALNGVILAGGASALGDLADAKGVEGVLGAALAALRAAALPDLAAGLASRKMLQGGAAAAPAVPAAALAGVDAGAVLAAVAAPLALLNRLAKEGVSATGNGTVAYSADEVAGQLSRCTRVAQQQLAPAAGDLAAGLTTPAEFQASYAPPMVLKALAADTMPSPSPAPAAPAAPPPSGAVRSAVSALAAVAVAAAALAV